MAERDPLDGSSDDDAPPPPVLSYQQPPPGEVGWTTVWTARNAAEANLAVGLLHERALHARVDMENVATLGPWGGQSALGTKVQVPRADVEAARAILAEVERRRALHRSIDIMKCPRCGAEDGGV